MYRIPFMVKLILALKGQNKAESYEKEEKTALTNLKKIGWYTTTRTAMRFHAKERKVVTKIRKWRFLSHIVSNDMEPEQK